MIYHVLSKMSKIVSRLTCQDTEVEGIKKKCSQTFGPEFNLSARDRVFTSELTSKDVPTLT